MSAEIRLPEAMGYDRTIAMFSPDGRLFQVEYAKEAVKRGITAVGVVFKDGAVLATVKPLDELMAPTSAEKVFQVDNHLGAVAAGYLADARVLIEYLRIKAQVHKITYEEPIDVWAAARVLGDRMQLLTQYGGLRPYGVIILLAGTDKSGNHLIEADPSGMLFEWYAYAIGRGAQVAMKILKQKWKQGMEEKDALKLATDVINRTERIKEKRGINIAVIKEGKYKRLSETEVEALLK